MLHAEGISAGYDGRDVVRGFTLALEPGECVHLAGVNGAGKTTVLRVLGGVLPPRGGRLNLPPRSQIGYAPTGFDIKGRMAVSRYLGQVLSLQGMALARAQAEAARLAEVFQLRPGMGSAVDSLSAGNRQIVNLIQALAGDRILLILDEPFTGLAPHARGALRTCVSDAMEAGAAVVYTDHAGHELVPHRTVWLGEHPAPGPGHLLVRDSQGVERVRAVDAAAAAALQTGDTILGWVE